MTRRRRPGPGFRFRSDELDASYAIAAEDGALVLRRPRYPDARLHQIAPDEFAHDEIRVRFPRGCEGAPDALHVTSGRAWGLRLRR